MVDVGLRSRLPEQIPWPYSAQSRLAIRSRRSQPAVVSSIYITAIRLTHPSGNHEHITHVWYNETSQRYQAGHANMTVLQAIEQLGRPGNSAKVYNPNTGGTVLVNVVPKYPAGGYLRTNPDNTTADNLLSLPRM